MGVHTRFTGNRVGRGRIPRHIREQVLLRDNYTCQYCARVYAADELTIDHLIPLAIGGPDEVTNYVSACASCNSRKGCLPLQEFAATIKIDPRALPLHGDPVIENQSLPSEIRALRLAVFHRVREGTLKARGRSAQKRIEEAYRRSLWETEIGRELKREMPSLPGQARAIIPEIRTIAKSEEDYLLLVELAKSASTRNLIGSVLTKDSDLVARLRSKRASSKDAPLNKRIDEAIDRWQRELRRRKGDRSGRQLQPEGQ